MSNGWHQDDPFSHNPWPQIGYPFPTESPAPSESGPDQSAWPPARSLDPVRDPWSVLSRLRPHYSSWEALREDELGTDYRPAKQDRVFVEGRRGWEEARPPLFREVGQRMLVIRRRQSTPVSEGAAPYRSQQPASIQPPPVPVNHAPPSVSFSYPWTTACDHRTRCRCPMGVGPIPLSDSNRDVSLRQGKPWLRVYGHVQRADQVLLEWDGPTRGSARVAVNPGTTGWEHHVPVAAGSYRFRVSATGPGGTDVHELDPVRLLSTVEFVELFYDTARRILIPVTADQLADLMTDDRELAACLEALFKARSEGDEKAVGEAAEKAQSLLAEWNKAESLADGGDAGNITEVWRVRGNKWTYVRSDKLRNHWRKYGLKVDMRERSTLKRYRDDNDKLQIDLKKLARDMRKKLREQSGLEAELIGWPEKSAALKQWTLKNAGVEPVELFSDEHGAILKADGSAQAMRIAGGANLNAGYNPSTGGIGLHARATGSLAMFEARGSVEAWLPGEKGHQVHISLHMHDGSRKEVSVGAFRAAFEFGLYGFAGASVALSADLEFTVDEGKVLVRGVTDPAVVQKKDPDFQPFGASASAFAGVRFGCELKGGLEWASPVEGNPGAPAETKWETLAQLGLDGHLDLGAGAEAGFTLSYERGKFCVRAKASAVLGWGCGGDVAWTVHADHLFELVRFVYYRLGEENFDRLQFIQETAFKALYRLYLFEMWKADQWLELYEQGEFSLQLWWADFTKSLRREAELHKNAIQLARRINSHPRLFDYATPEARGHMLRVLCHTHWLDDEEEQEDAIRKLLATIKTRREYQETLEHMTWDASRISWQEGKALLDNILDWGDQRWFDRWQRRLARLEALPDAPLSGIALAGLTNDMEHIA